jgi:HPt (histidine-containing phosphotransfer) domain-containing protein
MATYRAQDVVCSRQIQAATAGSDSVGMPSKGECQVKSASGPAVASGDLDRASLMARFEGDTELFEEVSAVFIDDCPRMLGELRSACDRGDLVALREAAHALKGAVSNFTGGAARDAALATEQQALHGQPEAFRTAATLEALVIDVSAALVRATSSASKRLA